MEKDPSLSLCPPNKAMGRMNLLLSQGLRLSAPVGLTLGQLLRDHLGLNAHYVENRIQTAFVNGRAVDRFDELFIQDGDVIALSAAMPGLVGATLRKGGFYAGLRADISQTDEKTGQSAADGFVVIKLFNQIAAEIGPQLLARRFWIKAEVLQNHLKRLQETDGIIPKTILVNGQPQPVGRLDDFIQSNPWVAVQFENA
jgi:hypothetical protein